MRSPDVVELRSFCVAADTGSLGRAAVRLGVSQPALSKRLQGLERLAGVRLLDRSSRGVSLTPPGRRLYEEARRLLEHADAVEEVILGLRRESGPVRLAASHSAGEAFAADVLTRINEEGAMAVELVSANSLVVRDLVAHGQADLGVAASRLDATPNPGLRELPLGADAIVCAVPRGHLWAQRRHISVQEFLRTPMVVRDPASNARWTVDSVLRRHARRAAPPLVQASTPADAMREALARNAPTLLSRWVIRRSEYFVEVEVDGLEFARQFVLVLPAVGEPTGDVRALADRLRDAVTA